MEIPVTRIQSDDDECDSDSDPLNYYPYPSSLNASNNIRTQSIQTISSTNHPTQVLSTLLSFNIFGSLPWKPVKRVPIYSTVHHYKTINQKYLFGGVDVYNQRNSFHAMAFRDSDTEMLSLIRNHDSASAIMLL